MHVEVTTPEQWLGDVVGDLNRRRGRIVGIEADQPGQLVQALVALPELLDYAQDLQALTHGHATYQTRLSHWVTTDGDEPDEGAGVPSPLRPSSPMLDAKAAAEPPPDDVPE